MNYYEHHLGDYLRDTAHLSMVEDGAYRRLLDAYYIAEAPFPDDKRELLKVARAVTKPERDAVEYVLKKFFVYEAGSGWLHSRCEREIARYQAKQAKAKASADARWSAHREHSERNANASGEHDAQDMRTHSERNANGMHRAPVPSPQTPDPIHLFPPDTGDGGTAQNAAPPEPPQPFDGTNAEALNGKAVVVLAPLWDLPEQWGLDAEALGFKPGEVIRQAEKFRQYWTAGKGSGTRRSVKGWRQSWSNWLDKAAKDQR